MKSIIISSKVFFCWIVLIAVVLSAGDALCNENAGDVNNNGIIDLADAVLTLQVISRTSLISPDINADVDGDSLIGLPEAVFVLQSISGLRAEQPGGDVYLAELSISGGNLNEPFHPDSQNYTANVSDDVDQITVTAATGTASAYLMINSTVVESGVPSSPIAIVIGENEPIWIMVVSDDGLIKH